MKLLEHEAKQLIRTYNIPTPQGRIIKSATDISIPSVLKAQVLSGQRNRYGGIQIINNKHSTPKALEVVESVVINGESPVCILAEELLSIEKEFYISLLINRENAQIELLASNHGGIDIESEKSESFLRKPISVKNIKSLSLKLAELFELETHEFFIEELLKNLLTCFKDNDATLLEINPLVLTADSRLIAADCKMTLDDAALFRHSEWSFFDTPANTNFVTLNQDALVATVANGAGLAMATVDAIESAGMSAANFLDIGGGANEPAILAALTHISHYPHLKAIIINIFGGITHCDEVARAILGAKQQIPNLPPLFIRLEGNRQNQAKEILKDSSLTLYDSLKNAIIDVQEVVYG